MKLESLNDLFLEQLKDIYSAEKQITQALPKMAEKAQHTELRKAFEMHLNQTEEQVKRLEKIFDELGVKGDGHKCKAMEGLIEEGNSLMKKDADPDVMDAGLIAAAQRVEHYEISAYGTAATYAERLGNKTALDLLKQTISEEKATDEKLTRLAETRINADAQA